MNNNIPKIILVSILLAVAGCASIDFDYPREESYALTETRDTELGKDLGDESRKHAENESGFYPMSDGIDALASRLLLAEAAEKSIDVQYYLIKSDIVGRAFIYVLLRAADRGVRVRLLLDDMFTKGYDVGMAALYSHPNFEIRIFNPFRRGSMGKAASGLTDFGRINRRMHNKSFTVDNQITLIGGRNIADEYFGAREDAKFGDLDVLAIGPIVQEVSDMFDTYWNHEAALPAPAFVKELDDPEAALNALRERLALSNKEIRDSRYAGAVREQIFKYVDEDASMFDWAPYELVVDSPDKGIKAKSEEAASIKTGLAESLLRAESEIVILSPYFVPLKSGIEWLTGIQEKGVKITIITNSLAANNQFTVHSGYKPSRKPLLQNGVKLYEVRPDAEVSGTEFVNASSAKATLHTKAFIVDQKEVFIGSFNFDPRSANINTELGVVIHDPAMAKGFKDLINEQLPHQAYEVYLNEDGKVRWRTLIDGVEVIYEKEPETSWWDRFKVGFVGIFPIKGQL